jgi:hypothetical protein
VGDERALLDLAAGHAADYIDGLPSRPVAAACDLEELRRRLGRPLSASGLPPEDVLNDLVRDVEGGLLGSSGGRSSAG